MIVVIVVVMLGGRHRRRFPGRTARRARVSCPPRPATISAMTWSARMRSRSPATCSGRWRLPRCQAMRSRPARSGASISSTGSGAAQHADIAAAVEFEPVAIAKMLGARAGRAERSRRNRRRAEYAADAGRDRRASRRRPLPLRPVPAGMDSDRPAHSSVCGHCEEATCDEAIWSGQAAVGARLRVAALRNDGQVRPIRLNTGNSAAPAAIPWPARRSDARRRRGPRRSRVDLDIGQCGVVDHALLVDRADAARRQHHRAAGRAARAARASIATAGRKVTADADSARPKAPNIGR